jgi:prevent-host-death family protein
VSKVGQLDLLLKEMIMAAKRQIRTILSSEAKTHFARLVDDVFNNHTRYIIQRFNAPRAVLISLADFKTLLQAEGKEFPVIRESGMEYEVGRSASENEIQKLLSSVEAGSE